LETGREAPGRSKSLRIVSVRLILSLLVGIALVSLLFSYNQVRHQRHTLQLNLEEQAQLVAENLEDKVAPALQKGRAQELQRLADRYRFRERLAGLVVYDAKGKPLAVTSGMAQAMAEPPLTVLQALSGRHAAAEYSSVNGTPIHIYVLPLLGRDDAVGALAVIHDTSYISASEARVWRDTLLRVLILGGVISLITILIVRWSLEGPIARAAQWIRGLRTGRLPSRRGLPEWEIFQPLARELATLAQSFEAARTAAETEARLRQQADSSWTAERLAVHVQSKLDGSQLFVVSNREPYMDLRHGRGIQTVVPPSGLVTALEPILCACHGTWIAHGSGDADRDTVDSRAHVQVPREAPRYTLRRVWLSKQEEEGYYFGFANEGLWPLCHIAHTRPIFRGSDWEAYRAVNQKFADAVLEEMEGTAQPILLVQDYHFALLPRMVKKQRPDARIAIFWHIPWPNAEAFGICPWQRELLDGLLGADLIGFHIQSHCNNFMETVDRVLESRVDWEHFSIKREDHRTAIRPFPISVDFQSQAAPPLTDESIYLDRANLLHELGVEALLVGVGVDRVDYTKGIPERFKAIEWMLEKYPVFRGQFTFLQIGAPSRTHIKRYHDLLAEVEAEAERINWRFQSGSWKPIVYLKGQHSHREIQRLYRVADLCLVTSLHDGMNLVAKEFLAARHDEGGMLVLSRFTGAARELRDAILVNPYDIEQTAEGIRLALEMEPEERQARMRRMRDIVRDNNVYRWAGNLIGDLCAIRLQAEPSSRPARVDISAA
jgi:trehalose-6-phosphate synthase/uncharacterized membrane protein affecting hemolysin expression